MDSLYALPRLPENDSITELLDLNAHIVLCRYDPATRRKPPTRELWQKRMPSHAEILAHRNRGPQVLYGIIPSSLGQAVADIDAGDPDYILDNLNPHLAVPSLRSHGVHLWWPSQVPQSPGHFEDPSSGVAGDIRGKNSYIIIWGDLYAQGLIRIAHANPTHDLEFPADYFNQLRTPPSTNPSYTGYISDPTMAAARSGRRSGTARARKAHENAGAARRMRNEGLSNQAIAKKLQKTERSVFRYLSMPVENNTIPG